MAGIILAAGESRRMGEPKQLLPWGDGTIIEAVADAHLRSRLDSVCVVLGGNKDRISTILSDSLLKIVENPKYQTGMAGSVKVGLRAIGKDFNAALVSLGDQPQVTTSLIDSLIERYEESGAPVVMPRMGEKRGHPTLLDSALWPGILNLAPDEGLNVVVRRYADKAAFVDVDDPRLFLDMDTPEEYERAKKLLLGM